MRIPVEITGGMERYFRETRFSAEVPAPAALADLMPHFAARLRTDREQPYWNAASCAFRGPVLVLVRGKAAWTMDTPLHDEEPVLVRRLLMGG